MWLASGSLFYQWSLDNLYTGCQIINKNLFKSYSVDYFSISKIWDELINKDQLYGFKSLEKFYHLTNIEIYKEILENK